MLRRHGSAPASKANHPTAERKLTREEREKHRCVNLNLMSSSSQPIKISMTDRYIEPFAPLRGQLAMRGPISCGLI
jgi:hypothetical protein